MLGPVRTTKRCPRCRETKPLDDFIRPRSGTPSDYCHPCRQAKRRLDYQRSGGAKVSYSQHVGRAGIGVASLDELHTKQGGLCGVCDQPETVTRNGVPRRLCADLDRVTGLVRGLVCARCIVLVRLLEDPVLVAAARAYLEGAR